MVEPEVVEPGRARGRYLRATEVDAGELDSNYLFSFGVSLLVIWIHHSMLLKGEDRKETKDNERSVPCGLCIAGRS